MAQFKWLHELDRPQLVAAYGPIVKLQVPKKNGAQHVVLPVDADKGFQPGEVLSADGAPIDFTDEWSLLILRADPRVEEIT